MHITSVQLQACRLRPEGTAMPGFTGVCMQKPPVKMHDCYTAMPGMLSSITIVGIVFAADAVIVFFF
eukprot:1153778-Pelagomonas_calceolata.AAC.2